jgi:hypothetical protein
MIAADGKLFVSTVAGGLYAFGNADGRAPRRFVRNQAAPAVPTELSEELLAATSPHGYAVFLGAPEAATLRHLAAETELRLIVVDPDSGKVEQLRRELVRTGVYGTRVAVANADPAAFEMPPYFASTIVVGSDVATEGQDRAFGSVRPYGGRLIVPSASGLRTRVREGALPGSTDYNGDFTASADDLVKAPLGVLWFDDTLGHFKRSPQPKIIGGVMISTTKDWLDASTREGTADYRLLPPTFSDVYTGRILSEAEAGPLKTQAFAKVDLETVQPSQYRPPTQKDDWKPEAPSAGYRRNPLTGETEPREFPKSYGCDGGFDYGHIYTMRSGTASFYDKRTESGTINISGPRSGCTNSIIPANGLLNLPYFYKGCTCSYPLPTGLSLYSLPESHEQWTTWGEIAPDQLSGKIQRLGVNFGAPADRMTESGTLWLDYPSAGGPSPGIEIETIPANPKSYYHHSVWMKGGEGQPWVAASGLEGIESVVIKGLKPGVYRVGLTFANPTGEERRFNIRLQGREVARDFSSGGRMIGATTSFPEIESAGSLEVELVAGVGPTQLSGIEVIAMELPE